ncbi:MAG: hypothetical protein KC657_33075 [Myxococcales bacterium]|nr:hypothetical protein [Myxococcales bacterium]
MKPARRWVDGSGPIAALVAAPLAYALVHALANASYDPLGRDQGIFQYVAWAMAHGERAYRDVRDVNGPLAPLVHLVFQALGGADEHRFRVLDLVVSGASFAAAAACLPGAVSWERGPRASRAERLSWAAAGAAALYAQYLTYFDYWDSAQRESFCVWFVLPASGLLLVAHRAAHDASPRARWFFVAAGALSVVPWSAKPTFALLSACHVIGVLIEPSPVSRARRLAWLALGGALAAVVGLAVVAPFVDVRAYLAIWSRDVPAMYRFIWPRPLSEIILYPQAKAFVVWAVASALLGVGLVVGRLARPVTLAVALCPGAAVLGLVAQGKGFYYHFHPVSAGVYFAGLAALSAVADSVAKTPRTRALVAWAAAMVALPHAGALARSAHGERTCARCDAAERTSPGYLARWRRVDYFPAALHGAAAFLRAHTAPDDRVQTYGMDPYVLFLAQRRSATPYVYAYDLDADAALAGSSRPGGLVPTEAQRDVIRAIRDAHEDDLLARLRADPPAAFVFVDRSPLMTYHDALLDLALHCPRTYAFVRDRYRLAETVGEVRVFLRDDAR